MEEERATCVILRAAPGWSIPAALFGIARVWLATSALYGPLFTIVNFAHTPSQLQQLIESQNLELLLRNNWTIASGVEHLLASPAPAQVLFGVDMALFLFVIPLASAVLALWCVFKPMGDAPTWSLRLMHMLARFGNLEVLLLAVLLYYAEMGEMIIIEVHEAVWSLVAFVPVLYGSLVCTTYAVRAAKAHQSSAGEKRQ